MNKTKLSTNRNCEKEPNRDSRVEDYNNTLTEWKNKKSLEGQKKDIIKDNKESTDFWPR